MGIAGGPASAPAFAASPEICRLTVVGLGGRAPSVADPTGERAQPDSACGTDQPFDGAGRDDPVD